MTMTKDNLPGEERQRIINTYGDDWDRGDYLLVGVNRDEQSKKPPRVIDFAPVPGATVPDSYQKLQIEIDRSLTVLNAVYPKQDRFSVNQFGAYFDRLKKLARASLGQDQVSLGEMALQAFQYDVLTRELGRIKNRYIIKLGGWALG